MALAITSFTWRLKEKLPPVLPTLTFQRAFWVTKGNKFSAQGGSGGEVPLISLPPHELLPGLFQKEMVRRNLVWRTAMELGLHPRPAALFVPVRDQVQEHNHDLERRGEFLGRQPTASAYCQFGLRRPRHPGGDRAR